MTNPIRLTGEPLPAPPRWKLALWDALDGFWPGADYRAATLRWQDSNARQLRVCQCGAPGTVLIADPYGGWAGAVPPTWWRCEEHATIPLNVPWCNGTPLINQTRDTCGWRSAPNATGIVSECSCGTHVGESMYPDYDES